MVRERTAPASPEGDFTRGVLEAAVLALPQLLRAEGGAVYLPSAERNALRAVARRNLSEPQAQALGDLLNEREVVALLASGRPFLPHGGEGVSPRLQEQLRHDNWPDLIAVPLPGTGRPAGVLAVVPEGEGRWSPGKIAAALDVGVLLATSLRAAVRATEGERRRLRADRLLDRLPFLRDPALDRDGALATVAGGVGDALELSHCLGILLDPPAFIEFCQPGATPTGAPAALEQHPAWPLLRLGSVWTYDDAEASPADRAATARLLNGLHVKTVIAIPVLRAGVLSGVLLLIQAERRRRLRDDETRFALIAAAELAARPDAAAHSTATQAAAAVSPVVPPADVTLPDPTSADSSQTNAAPPAVPAARTDAVLAAYRALAAAVTPGDAARVTASALAALADVHSFVLVRRDAGSRLLTLTLAVAGQSVIDEPDLSPAGPGDDLLSDAIAGDQPVSGDVARAVPRPWRRALRLGREAAALAIGVPLPLGARAALVVLGAERARLALASAEIELLATPLALAIDRMAAEARLERAESRAEQAEAGITRDATPPPAAPSTPVQSAAIQPTEGEAPAARQSPEATRPPAAVQAAEGEQRTDDFFNMAAHELRGPITTIRGGALTLGKRWAALDAETRGALLGDIAEEAERLNLLIEDLLTLTRAPSGIAIAAEPVLLPRLLDRVVAELGGKALGHTITIRFPPSLPPAEADPMLMRQVLRTLLENVAALTTRGEAVGVTAEVAAGAVLLGIHGHPDSALPADLDSLFEPFHRLPDGERPGGRDAGLSLAVARRLVEAQNGRLWAERRGDEALMIQLALPAVREDAPE